MARLSMVRTNFVAAAGVLTVITGLAIGAGDAKAASVAWAVRAVAEPSTFSPVDQRSCELQSKCDRYQVLVSNLGDAASSGPVTLTITLPPGITTHESPESGISPEGTEWSCTSGAGISVVTCMFPESVASLGYVPSLDVRITPPGTGLSGPAVADLTVTGGGGAPASKRLETPIIASGETPFAIPEFAFEPSEASGVASTQAGGHPWQLSTTLSTSTTFSVPSESILTDFSPVKNLKNVTVELPPGMLGNPNATLKCTQADLVADTCPPAARVGQFAVIGGAFQFGGFEYTGRFCCSAVYSMVPESGYPAEFAFKFAGQLITLYASLVWSPEGYRIRAAATGLPAVLEITTTVLTFFGNPGAVDETGSTTAFLANPANCEGDDRTARLSVQSWEAPLATLSADTVAYQKLIGCDALQFDPRLTTGPADTSEEGVTRADSPSAYSVELTVPQTTQYGELGTPPLKSAKVTLPAGVSISPSTAQGLAGCEPTGPHGINLGTDHIGDQGQDLGDPEATEFGAGHGGGNGSPYDDGLYHAAPGHCPPASTLGTVEVFTPLLPEGPGGSAPLTGHVYLAQPRCGGPSQPACTEASATNGELYGLYLEATGSGVIVKLAGTVAADPATGQLEATFANNPQLPFERLRLHFHGGSRAPLANPQACGSFAASSVLTSWAGQEVAGASPAFAIGESPAGGPCPGAAPFAPQVTTGTTNTSAGGFSPFVLRISRQDGEQNLTGVTESFPPGLLARIAGVTPCEEAQANLGTCAAASQIGTASVLAGPGATPIAIGGGQVYLTRGYRGAPYGLAIVQPAVAGPINLGNVVVRAAIHIDPNTAAVSVSSDPLPVIRDGVPFRLRAVNLEIDRSGGFVFNPTNCAAHSIVTTTSGSLGGSSTSTEPFAVTGCAALPFGPSIEVTTAGRTSKANGASLAVKVTQRRGEANIQKVQLQLPKSLPSRLTTLQKACTDAQFKANPAGCPEASNVGTATATTPVLNAPLTGPAYLVSHGGAAFPDLEFVLQAEGVSIVLDGKTDIKKGITYSRFETVPDAPISAFEAKFPQGPHSVLAANGDLCSQSLAAPTILLGQNGKQVSRATKIVTTGCARSSVKVLKIRVRGHSLTVTVSSTRAGRISFKGASIKPTTKSVGVGTSRVKIQLSKRGRSLRSKHRKTSIKLRLVSPNGSAGLTRALKL